jgi:hypothetical protein
MDIKKALNEKNVGEHESKARMAVGFLMFAGGVFKSLPIIGLIGLGLFITGIRKNCLIKSLLKK